MYDCFGEPDHEGMLLARQKMREISEDCDGWCEGCPLADDCPECNISENGGIKVW